MTDTIDLLKHSVTAADHPNGAAVPVGSAWNLIVAPINPMTATPGLPPYWSRQRDLVFASTREMEDMWSSAMYRAKTKTAALGWEVKDQNDSDRRARRYQQIILGFDGKRWVPGFSKVLDDFLLTDNGAFVEIVRATSAAGSRILGLMHLDSFRCTRTGDPARPVLYQDAAGKEHVMRDYQVLDFSDEPSARVGMNGVGRCAASRAFRTILKLTTIEIYFREKVSGDRNLAIHIVNGISSDYLEGALTTAREERARRGYVFYKGSVIIPAVKMDQDLSVVTIPLAEVPDGFDIQQERQDAYLRYANALGVPVQDLQPLSGQGLGTGTQTVILQEAAEGAGLAAFLQDWKHALNEDVLPETTTFSWVNRNDTRDQKAKADVAKMRADERAARIGSGEISPAMARQIAVDVGDLPREMLVQDATTDDSLSDDEKPQSPDVPNVATLFPAPDTPPKAAQDGAQPALKAADDLDTLLDAELSGALDVLRRVAGDE
jgi:hypothetical protein